MKNQRFPSVAAIRNNLSTDNRDNIYPAMSGALTAYYKIATEEFEHLRTLSKAAAEGDPEAVIALKEYLEMVDKTAEMYAEDVRFAPAG